uniref:C2H2-type domain-containing protein n=1 Tax=Lutzomyia longipalpis TaxID=7200 RepID=A0A1B0GLF7_LUTLO
MEFTEDSENLFLDTSIVKEEYGIRDGGEVEFKVNNGEFVEYITSSSAVDIKEEPVDTTSIKEEETISNFLPTTQKKRSKSQSSKNNQPEKELACPRHETIHIEDRPSFACKLCSKVFKWSKNLAAHRKICAALQTAAAIPDAKNIPPLRLFECALCGKQFAYKQELRSHIWIHIKDRPKYFCKICGNKYNTTQSLGQHAKSCVKMKELPHLPCLKCGNKFHKVTSLAQHERMCNKPRKQKDNSKGCKICGKEFTNYYEYKNHSNMHAKERLKYSCPCGISYYWASNLRRHKKTCSKSVIVLNFFCRTCGSGFEEESTKNEHEQFCNPQDHVTYETSIQNTIWLPVTQNSTWRPETDVGNGEQ